MIGINKVILIGNVGQEPKYTQFDDGKEKLSFSLATGEKFNGKEYTEWHNVVVWGKFAGIAKPYIKKGSKLFVEGRKQTRKYDDANGEEKQIVEIVSNDIKFLDAPPQTQQNANSKTDDLPF